MTTLQKAVLLLVTLGVCLAITAGVKSHLEADGAIKYAMRDDVTVMKVLRAASNTITTVYKPETVTLVHDKMHYDTVHATITQYLRDTLPVPVQVVREVVTAADTTIHACMIVRSECEAGWANAKAQVTTLTAELAKQNALKPSPWLPHPGFGVAAGVNPNGKFDVVAGLTFDWKFP